MTTTNLNTSIVTSSENEENGHVNARQLHRLLEEGASFDLWLFLLKADFPMHWDVDYFSESPFPRWKVDSLNPPNQVEGHVSFTASLAEKITAEPLYFVEPYDFSDLIATYQAIWNHGPIAAPLDFTGASDSIHRPQD